MSFNTYPQNPYPSNSEMLQKLDAVAKAIDNMPIFTSNDKAFLEELPSFPNVDGKKVLTATTESGETSLSYEEIENELPEEPSADGKKVLTATTESGETVLSWEEPESEIVNFSTTEQKNGQKWVDGKDIYFITAQNVTYGTSLASNVDKIIDARIARHGKSENEAYKVFGDGFVQNDGGTITLIDGVATYSPWSSSGDLLVTTADHVILYYTKTESEV